MGRSAASADFDGVDPPDLPELTPGRLTLSSDGELALDGQRVSGEGGGPVEARRVVVAESELAAVALSPGRLGALRLTDVRLGDCDLSNLIAHGATLTRVEINRSRLLGFQATEATVRDLRVTGCAASLASFAHSNLRDVVFEGVNLEEASFLGARLTRVAFIDCTLVGADFRDADLSACTIRGASLDGVLGVPALRGVAMPWPDLVASTAALATALGIVIAPD